MSQESPLENLSFTAEIDLSADAAPTTSQRFRAVKLGTAAKQVNDLAADTDVVIGVQKNLPKIGEAVDVATEGTTKIRAGGAINVNTYAKVDAAGKFVQGGAGADRNWCLVLEAAAADGDIVEAKLTGLVVT